jgi:hypothetical protein
VPESSGEINDFDLPDAKVAFDENVMAEERKVLQKHFEQLPQSLWKPFHQFE